MIFSVTAGVWVLFLNTPRFTSISLLQFISIVKVFGKVIWAVQTLGMEQAVLCTLYTMVRKVLGIAESLHTRRAKKKLKPIH